MLLSSKLGFKVSGLIKKSINNMKTVIINILRKCTIFNQLDRPIIPFRINLLYYRGKTQNVGDHLSKILFDLLLDKQGVKSRWQNKTLRVSFIGSVIQFIGAKAIIYGSGILREDVVKTFARKKIPLDIRAVRGPLTKKALESIGYSVPSIFGDPAVLLPLFYNPQLEKKEDYIIIPHWTKVDNYKNHPCLSPITHDWTNFIDRILSAKLVISASLHGIIIAEAYGVPAVFLNDTENEDIFKYKDYYYSTGRYDFNFAHTIEEAFLMEKNEMPSFAEMQKNLLNAFPFNKQ